MSDSPSLILFTGLPEAGVSTRVAASRVALSHENGFKAYEVDRDGKPVVDNRNADEFELLDLMLPQAEPVADAESAPQARRRARHFFNIEAGGQKNQAEIWERGLHDAIGQLDRVDFDGIVISVPIEVDRRVAESQLDSLIRPLRKKYWIDFKQSKLPYIIFDLTKYDALFCQIVADMLDEPTQDRDGPSASTPFSFAMRREVQELAVRSFCQRWIADNELTYLCNAERQRCSTVFRPRVMMQVSSAWGFIAADSGPGARQPANCMREGDVRTGSQKPRFPEFSESERRMLTNLKRGTAATGADNVKARVEKAVERLYSIWRPLGVVEPIPSVVWRTLAPNMFWAPEMMSSIPPR
jgi:hypothetical protein